MKGDLTHEHLVSLLRYDSATGIFYWYKRRGGRTFDGCVAGTKDNNWYVKISINSTAYLAHRLAWFYVHKQWPKDELDHCNGNVRDNRIENLRQATSAQQKANTKLFRNNKSGFKGVSWHDGAQRWRATICLSRKQKHLGFYDSPEDAHAAYCIEAIARRGDFARLR